MLNERTDLGKRLLKMGSKAAPHDIGYEANIGLKRKNKDIYSEKDLLGNEVAVRWILSFWIWVWLTLLLGIIAIPLAVCKIAMTWDQGSEEIWEIGNELGGSETIAKKDDFKVTKKEEEKRNRQLIVIFD